MLDAKVKNKIVSLCIVYEKPKILERIIGQKSVNYLNKSSTISR
jgi:hypothetical protein